MYLRNLPIGAAYKVVRVPPESFPRFHGFLPLLLVSTTDRGGLILQFCTWTSKISWWSCIGTFLNGNEDDKGGRLRMDNQGGR